MRPLFNGGTQLPRLGSKPKASLVIPGSARNKGRVWLTALPSADASVNGALQVQRQGDWSYLHAER